MKKMRILVALFIVSICFCLVACQRDTTEEALPNGLFLAVEDIPSIGSFSGRAYDECAEYFPTVDSVTLYLNGSVQSLSVTDERVIRLLNFIGNSLAELSYTYTTGLVEADEIERWYEKDAMLEIVFQATQPGDAQKLLVSGNSCLKILDPEAYAWADGAVAEQNWPYMQMVDPYGGTETQWIDLLMYAELTK